MGKRALSPGFPEYFVYLVGFLGNDTGTSPSVETNAIPASFRFEALLLIGKCSTGDKSIETGSLILKFGVSQNENNWYIPV